MSPANGRILGGSSGKGPAVIFYEYTVYENIYKSSNYAYGYNFQFLGYNRKLDDEITNKFLRVNKMPNVCVYYNPHNPNQSVVERGTKYVDDYFFISVLGNIFCLAILIWQYLNDKLVEQYFFKIKNIILTKIHGVM